MDETPEQEPVTVALDPEHGLSATVVGQVVIYLAGSGGGLVAVRNREGEWVAAAHWAYDGDLAGAAAYGIGPTAAEAFNAMTREMGLEHYMIESEVDHG